MSEQHDCTHCGASVDTDAGYCSSCGATIAQQVSREPIADTEPWYTEWRLKWQYFHSLFEWRSFVQHVAFGFLAAFLIYVRVRSLVSAAMQAIRRRKT